MANNIFYYGTYFEDNYTEARRYEFYVRVARTISHEWAQQTRGILFLPREHKVHIFEPTCNVLFVINILTTAFFTIFRRFLTTFRRFSKIVPNIFREFPKIPKDIWRVPKIFEDYRGRPEDVSMIQQSWHQWNHRYLHMWGYRIVFINLLSLGIPLTFI